MPDISKITLPNGDSYDIKDRLARQKILYGEIDSTSTATVFTATVEGFTELVDGTCCLIYNNVITSASGWTLNVNNTGALPVHVMQDNGRSTTGYTKTRTNIFVYSQTRVSGGCWLMGYFDSDTDTNSNSIGYLIRPGGYLKVKDRFYRYRLLFQVDDTYVMPSNTSTSTSATAKKVVNQRAFDPFGQVFIYYGTSNYAVDSVLGTTNWYQYSANIGYAFNHNGAAATMTANKSVYLKLRPVSNGKVKIYGWTEVASPSGNPSSLGYYEYNVTNDEYVVSTDTSVVSSKTYYQIDKSYTQELPSSDDGLLYMRLGVATSATELNLQIYHPIYYYSNGAIRLWTNSTAQAPFVVHVTLTSNTGGTIDRTASEVAEAFNSGREVFFEGYFSEYTYVRMKALMYSEDLSNDQIAISAYAMTEPDGTLYDVYIPYGVTNTFILRGVPIGQMYTDVETIKGNLVTSISSSSTDSQYPSAKCMYDIIGDVETLLAAI